MKILEYECRDVEDFLTFDFDRVTFQNVNLLVGNTATGKTRLLNTIFNSCLFVTRNEFKRGFWEMTFSHLDTLYRWKLRTTKREKGDTEAELSGNIEEEELFIQEGGQWNQIFERNDLRFVFRGEELPKLSLRESGIHLLKEEEIIKPVYKGFEQVMRRRFSLDALSRIAELKAIPPKLVTNLDTKRDLNLLFTAELPLNGSLYLISNYFPELFKDIKKYFRQTFPFVEEIRFEQLSKLQPNLGVAVNLPVVQLRERNTKEWIMLSEISSGMQKVLLILTDISLLPEGGIYIIDEYENSLGLNAIDFFPEYILTLEKQVQFFLTSHHPYIINGIPLKHWYVFHRSGSHVSIKSGQELEERFGRSKQQAFIQLINDPYYAVGVE